MTADYFQGDKIVSIQPARRQALFPALGQIETYWEGLRDGRLMPSRSEIDPRGIAAALEFAFVLEKIAPGIARIRLAGMHLNELMAMEVRGMPVTAMLLPDARREMQRQLEAVLETPAAVRLTLAGDTGLGRGHLEGQMLLLPLRDDMGRPTRILGALQTRGDVGRGPRRFTIRDVETKPLLGDPLTVARRPRAVIDGWDEARPPAHDPNGETPKLSARARDLARKIAAINKATDEADRSGRHLRLVYDADELA